MNATTSSFIQAATIAYLWYHWYEYPSPEKFAVNLGIMFFCLLLAIREKNNVKSDHTR